MLGAQGHVQRVAGALGPSRVVVDDAPFEEEHQLVTEMAMPRKARAHVEANEARVAAGAGRTDRERQDAHPRHHGQPLVVALALRHERVVVGVGQIEHPDEAASIRAEALGEGCAGSNGVAHEIAAGGGRRHRQREREAPERLFERASFGGALVAVDQVRAHGRGPQRVELADDELRQQRGHVGHGASPS